MKRLIWGLVLISSVALLNGCASDGCCYDTSNTFMDGCCGTSAAGNWY